MRYIYGEGCEYVQNLDDDEVDLTALYMWWRSCWERRWFQFAASDEFPNISFRFKSHDDGLGLPT